MTRVTTHLLPFALILGAAPAFAANSFSGDTYSLHHQLGAVIDDVLRCFSVHMAGMNDNTVTFDGATELLDLYTNGNQPFVFELEPAPAATVKGPASTSAVEINSIASDDLFPEGFEDPESGTALTAACLEIGIDDTLDSDEPIEVVSAQLTFVTEMTTLGPFSIASAFTNPWDGRLSVGFSGFAGRGIREVRLSMESVPSTAPIFSDGFESGNTAAWSNEAP